jgi:hypothetical protein
MARERSRSLHHVSVINHDAGGVRLDFNSGTESGEAFIHVQVVDFIGEGVAWFVMDEEKATKLRDLLSATFGWSGSGEA